MKAPRPAPVLVETWNWNGFYVGGNGGYSWGRSRTTVDYFSAEAVSGEFAANDEVDELRWLDPVQASHVLTYDHDIELAEEIAQS